MRKEDLLRVANLLEQAERQGMCPARQEYVYSDCQMCATAAMYKVATGIVPYRWDYDHTPQEIAEELSRVLGIDFSAFSRGFSFFGRMMFMNDYGVPFIEIAATLRREAKGMVEEEGADDGIVRIAVELEKAVE